MYAYKDTHAHTYIHTYVCMYVCMYACMYVCMCTPHTHTYTHTHTHTHTPHHTIYGLVDYEMTNFVTTGPLKYNFLHISLQLMARIFYKYWDNNYMFLITHLLIFTLSDHSGNR